MVNSLHRLLKSFLKGYATSNRHYWTRRKIAMDLHTDSLPGSKRFLYFPLDIQGQDQKQQQQQTQGEDRLAKKDVLDKLLKALGREALREKTPTLRELEQTLQDVMKSLMSPEQEEEEKEKKKEKFRSRNEREEDADDSGMMPIVRQLVE